MNIEKIDAVFFYTVEHAIKSYRQFAQRELKKHDLQITVDQWLILKGLSDHPQSNQKELARLVFKDAASVTRIIDHLIAQGYISRKKLETDRRQAALSITREGVDLINEAQKVVLHYRAKALGNISQNKIDIASQVLKSVISNCK